VVGRRKPIHWIAIGAIVALTAVAFGSWQTHERRLIARAGIPPVPDLSRWPAGFAREVQRASEAVLSEPDSIEPLARLAAVYHANVYNAEAAQALDALHRLEPKNPRWVYLLADLRLRAGESDAATQALRETLELDPGNLPAWFRLARELATRGEIDAARACYARAVEAAPQDVLAAYFQIAFEAAHGDRSEARHRLTELVQANPGFPQLHASLAELHFQSGDLEHAGQERLLAATTDRELKQPDPWVDELAGLSYDIHRLSVLADEAIRARRLGVAEKLLTRAILIAPFEASLWGQLESVHRRAGRPEHALRWSEVAVALIPDDPGLHAEQSALLCELGRPQEAIERAQSALQRWPENAGLHEVLGVALGITGQPEAAAAALREAIRLDPTRVDALFNLGISLHELGQHEAARAAAQQALSIRPDYLDALALLASLALKSADSAAAESAVIRILTLSPRADARGLVATLAPYLRFEPENADAYLLLGEVLRDAGRLAEARAIFQQGLLMSRQNGRADQAARFRQALERSRDTNRNLSGSR